jgi:hypothetical protein
MSRKKAHTPEEVVNKLRQIEVLTGQGKPVAEAVRMIGVDRASDERPPCFTPASRHLSNRPEPPCHRAPARLRNSTPR